MLLFHPVILSARFVAGIVFSDYIVTGERMRCFTCFVFTKN